MANSFLLLILPTRALTIHLGRCNDNVGLSLRGSCYNAADARHLDQAIDTSLESRPAQLWVDCQQLNSLSLLGQRTLLQADKRSRAIGTTLYWSGLAGSLLGQLASSGLSTMLNLVPADDFAGPRFVLPTTKTAAAQLSW